MWTGKRILALVAAFISAVPARAQSSSAFTYQGKLDLPGAPASTTVDLRFQLSNSSTSEVFTGSNVVLNVPVDRGVCTTLVDFGSAAFSDGAQKWMEVSVRWPAGSGSYTVLGPRQAINAVPLAAGLRAIPTRPGGTATLNLEQGPAMNVSTSPVGGFQTFTSAATGRLASIDFLATAAPAFPSLFVMLHAGGPDGPAIDSFLMEINQVGLVSAVFPGAYLQQGKTYTIRFVSSSNSVSFAKAQLALPNSKGADANGSFDYFFRVYVSSPATIDASVPFASYALAAHAVHWSDVLGVPDQVAHPFQPWTPEGNNIRYTQGFLGVGSVSPTVQLHVSTTNSLATQIESSSNAGTWLNLRNTSAGGSFWRLISSGANNGEGAGKLIIGTGGTASANTTCATFQSNGNVGIGITSPTQRLHVNGNVLANNVAVPSSIRFKDRVEPMDDALANLLKLSGVRFDWKPEYAATRPGREHDIGFVAEEVEKVFPEVVFHDDSGNVTGMDYSRLTAVAIEAIKQQHAQFTARIDALESQLARREQTSAAKQREIADLQERLTRLEAKLAR